MADIGFRKSVRSCSILKHITEQHCLLYVVTPIHWAWKYAVVLLNK